MSRHVKGLVQSHFEGRIRDDGIDNFVIVDLSGLGGVENNQLRGELKAKGMRLMMVRNLLFRKALSACGMDSATELFEGPCVIAYGGESIVDLAKELVARSKKLKNLQIKGAFLDGAALGEREASDLAKLPTRAELQAMVAAAAASPGARIAGCISGPMAAIAGCIETLCGKIQKEAA